MVICVNYGINIIGAHMEDRVRDGYGALSKDIELLTPTGWLNIRKVTKETLVAQYWIDGQITFGYPTFIRVEKVQKAVHIHNKLGYYDQLVGIYHAIPYICLYTNNVKVTSASNITRNNRRKYFSTGVLHNEQNVLLSSTERLKIAFQADGTVNRRGIKSDRIGFGFTKRRKIDYFYALMNHTNTTYRNYICEDGRIYFYFYSLPNTYDKNFDWIDLSKVNAKWCQDFIHELSQWDATVYQKKYLHCVYTNTNKLAIDRAQAIASLAGYRTCMAVNIRDKKWKPAYVLSILAGRKNISGDSLTVTTVEYSDSMYTITMPSNMLLIRHNNAVTVTGCGNCDLRLPKDQIIRTNCWHMV